MFTDILKSVLANPLFVKYGLAGLFLNCVFASVIPFPIVLTSTALLMDGQNPNMVFLIMAVGSIIGGILTYFIGQDGKRLYKILRKTHTATHYNKGHEWLNRHGWIIIFILSLVPIMTEVVTIISGAQRYNFKKFAIAMALARTSSAIASVYFGNLFVQYFNNIRT